MDGKKACEKLLDAMQLEKQSYRVGTSKVICSFEWPKKKIKNISVGFQRFFSGLRVDKTYWFHFHYTSARDREIEMIY